MDAPAEHAGAECTRSGDIMQLFHCAVYLAATGVLGFVLGRVVPKSWFSAERFPYRCAPWEQKLWRALRVKTWQARVPDMSRIFPRLMPPKKMTAATVHDLPRMVQETCVAEWIHTLLSLTGLYCLHIWRGWGGIAVTLVYILFGNLPFIIIQRYNRPRLQRLLARQSAQNKSKGATGHENADSELQHGRGPQFLCQSDSGGI